MGILCYLEEARSLGINIVLIPECIEGSPTLGTWRDPVDSVDAYQAEKKVIKTIARRAVKKALKKVSSRAGKRGFKKSVKKGGWLVS